MKRSSLVVAGLFLLVYVLVYVLPLGARPMMIPDETRYAEIPREMIASGDWVVPRLDGMRYFEKPVLGYWLNALSIELFGENAFAVRFPSALAAGLSALMVFMLASRFAGGRFMGSLAAAVFLTCGEVMGIGVFGMLDTMFSLFVTATLTTFFFAFAAPGKSRRKTGLLLLSGVFCGLAFLTKGFLAFALPLLIVVPFLIWEKRWKEAFRLAWLPLVAAVLVSAPWAILIHLREPDFWHYFFWTEHVRRFMSSHAQHRSPFWYFSLTFLGVAMPWTFLLPAGIAGMKKRLKDPLVRYALCWFVFPFLLFSASRGKLATYILPCFPALAILMSVGLHHYLADGREKAFKAGALALAALMAVLAIGLAGMQATDLPFKPYAQAWKGVLGVFGLASCALFLWFAVRGKDPRKKLLLYAGAPVLLMFCAPFLVPDQALERKAPGALLRRNEDRVRPESILVTDGDLVRATCWFYKRADVYLLAKEGELGYSLGYEDAKHRLLTLREFEELVLKYAGTGRIILIVKSRRYRSLMQGLPRPLMEDSNGADGFAFVQY